MPRSSPDFPQELVGQVPHSPVSTARLEFSTRPCSEATALHAVGGAPLLRGPRSGVPRRPIQPLGPALGRRPGRLTSPAPPAAPIVPLPPHQHHPTSTKPLRFGGLPARLKRTDPFSALLSAASPHPHSLYRRAEGPRATPPPPEAGQGPSPQRSSARLSSVRAALSRQLRADRKSVV